MLWVDQVKCPSFVCVLVLVLVHGSHVVKSCSAVNLRTSLPWVLDKYQKRIRDIYLHMQCLRAGSSEAFLLVSSSGFCPSCKHEVPEIKSRFILSPVLGFALSLNLARHCLKWWPAVCSPHRGQGVSRICMPRWGLFGNPYWPMKLTELILLMPPAYVIQNVITPPQVVAMVSFAVDRSNCIVPGRSHARTEDLEGQWSSLRP